MANEIKKFLLYGEKANLPVDRDANVLYWCTDTRELYKGNDLYTEAVRIVESMPDTTKMAQGVLYVVASTGEAKIFDGTQTRTIVKEYTNTVNAESTSDQVATADAVYEAITTAVGDVVNNGGVVNNIFSTKAGTVTVTKGEYIQLTDTAVYDENTVYFKKVESAYVPDNTITDQETLAAAIATGCYISADATDVAVKGVVVNPTYDAATRTITLPYADGTESLEINLGKDIFVDPTAQNGYNAETGNIELYLNDSTTSTVDVFTEVPVAYKEDDVQEDPDNPTGSLYVGVIEGINTDKLSVTVDPDTTESTVTVYKMVDGQLVEQTVALDAIVDVDNVNYVKVADTESVVDLYTATGAATPADVCIGDAHTASTGNADEVAAAQAGEKVYLKSTETSTSSTMIEIPASALVDIYTGGTGDDKSATVSVSDTNVITATVNVSAAEGNTLSKKDDGLFVDSPTKQEHNDLVAAVDALDAQLNGEIITLKADGAATEEAAKYTFNADDSFTVDGVDTVFATAEEFTAAMENAEVLAVEVSTSNVEDRLASVEASVSALDAVSSDAIYVQLEEGATYDADTRYFVVDEDGNFVDDAGLTINSQETLDAALAPESGKEVFILAADAIDVLADRVTQNEADIAANATAIKEVTYVKCTDNTIYDETVTYYEVQDGEFVQHTTAVDADTFAAAVTAGTVYVKTVDAVKENEDRLAAIESALTWSTFS